MAYPSRGEGLYPVLYQSAEVLTLGEILKSEDP